MITTLCLNPSFDRTVEVDELKIGEVNRIRTSRKDVGGKGINVAVVLRRLGMETKCIGCAGEKGVEAIRAMLDGENIQHDFLTVPGEVRTNVKIVTRDAGGATELNEAGEALGEDSLQAFMALAEKETQGSEYTVLTGSLPPGCPEGTYQKMIQHLPHTKCVLDATGKELLLGAQAHPFLIKPNLQELQQTLGLELRTLRTIRDAAMIFIARGVQYVTVSMGAMGALLVSHEQTLFAPALRVSVKSTVGAGDAMLGGLIKGLAAEGTMQRAFRYGVAAGAASVMTEGTQLIRPEVFDELLSQVRVQEV